MEAVLEQVGQLPALLAVSRSSLVRDWDSLTLDRALEWARYFQHLHDRFRTRPRLREALGRRPRGGGGGRRPPPFWLGGALGRRLGRGQPSPLLGFPHLGRCPQLLGLACWRCPAARRGPRGGWGRSRKRGAARGLLLSRLREEGQEAEPSGEAAGRLRWLSGVLEQLPQPRAFELVAAALLLLGQGSGAEQAGGGDRDGNSLDGNQASGTGDGYVVGPLLSWLLGNLERFSAFCLFLPGSLLASLAGHYSQLSKPYLDLLTGWGSHLLYDPLRGQWVKSCLEEAELSWEELRERFCCLCQGSALLRGQTQATLNLLKARDGDFKVSGLSVWTDLQVEV
ncbi:Fanconi anemia group F protein, partial [Nipponia nippon]